MLPATKVLPKELLPLVDRPIVQYGVEEAVRSGIRQVVLITNPENTLTTSHFNVNQTLESALAQNKKSELLETVRNLTTMANVTSLPQVEPRGLGHAVLCGKPAVGDHPFAVLLPDDVIDAEPAALQQMLDVFSWASVLAKFLEITFAVRIIFCQLVVRLVLRHHSTSLTLCVL